MRYGYRCEDCQAAIFPVTTRSELQWLRNRLHVVREVAAHSSTGLDSWMTEGLAFLEEHQDHSVGIVATK